MRPQGKGAAVIIEDGDKVLLVRHTYGKRKEWFFPGGGIKRSEDPIDAAIREAREEVGLDLKVQFLGQVSGVENWRKITDTYYHAPFSRGVVVIDKKEIAEYGWWPKESLPKLSPLSKLAARQFVTK